MKTEINAIELFYSEISSGIFKDPQTILIPENKIDFYYLWVINNYNYLTYDDLLYYLSTQLFVQCQTNSGAAHHDFVFERRGFQFDEQRAACEVDPIRLLRDYLT